MSHIHTVEARLLLACVRATPDGAALRALAGSAVDWLRVAGWANHLRVGPLVFAALREALVLDALPTDALTDLTRQYDESHQAWACQLERLVELLDALAVRGVRPTLLKGAALASTVYEEPGLRTMSDVDLLTTRDELPAVEDALYELAYAPGQWCSEPEWFVAHHHHLVPFVSGDRALTVEVHHSIMPPWAFDVPTAGLLERAEPHELEGRPVRVLAPEDQLLHVCLHLALEFCAGLRGVADIARLLNERSAALAWPRLVDSAHACDGARQTGAALLLARSLLGAPVSDEVVGSLVREDAQGRLEASALSWLLPRAVLHHPALSPLPVWLLNDWSRMLLAAGPAWHKPGLAVASVARGYLDSVRDRAATRGHPVWATALVHPAWLLARRFTSRR